MHADLQSKVDAHRWFHSIDFGNGVASKGHKSIELLAREASAYFDGIDLSGRSVLDIGAWNGAVSFKVKQAGAARVVAADKLMWNNDHYRGRPAFDLARSLLDIEIEAVEIDVPEITKERLGAFDVVLFLGVFYHLYDAPALTRQVSQCASDLLILETHQDALSSDKPAMVFYPGTTLNNDGSNWWGPNPQCVYEILKHSGFHQIFYQDHPDCGRQRGIFHAFRDAGTAARMCSAAKSWLNLANPTARDGLFRPCG